jgi:hypothetical protein
MIDTARDRIAALHVGASSQGFSASCTASPDDLQIEVRGIGRLQVPVPEAQAKQLCQMSRPARYGKGELTLVDRAVRDTWEVPKSRIKIDNRRWGLALGPALESLRRDLGLPDGCRLEAQLHSMLVYAPGQFFVQHQDSEKDDAMIGSLVVTLPGSFRGGALEVTHCGHTVTHRGSKKYLSMVAFYSGCRHQVRPVRSGYRVVLTYNLLRRGRADGTDLAPGVIGEAAGVIDDYFAAPDHPSRLLSLLDHEYTQRGLSWARLKGSDATWAALLRAAAERSGCEIVLALIDVQETWSAYQRWERSGYGGWGYPRWESWDDDEDEYDSPSEGESWGGADYEPEELIESQYRIDSWIDSTSGRIKTIGLDVAAREVCAATLSGDLEPYNSEYEGYMGNWGNTLDRWYHRGALVLWPRGRAFAVRAEASPAWALDELRARVKGGDLAGAREAAGTVAQFWEGAVGRAGSKGLFTKALRVAALLEEPAIASLLLGPFWIELLVPSQAKPLAVLVDRYGNTWAGDVVAGWSAQRRWDTRREPWIASLPCLCETLLGAGASGPAAGLLLLSDSWRWVASRIERAFDIDTPSWREKDLEELADPVAAVFESAECLEAHQVREEATELLCRGNQGMLSCALAVLRQATPANWVTLGLEAVAVHCLQALESRLAHPPRDPADWSIQPPSGCQCELCQQLARFLSDPVRTSFEWPLRKDRRAHLHNRIDTAELPVDHQTRRKGSPYTLVLTKTTSLFRSEEAVRRRDERDRAWLKGAVTGTRPRRKRRRSPVHGELVDHT